MKLAVTGHRPDRIGISYDLDCPLSSFIRENLRAILLRLKPDEIISGMALGVDMIWAELGLELGVPSVIAAIPFEGQEKAWPDKSQWIYNEVRKFCSTVVVSPGGYEHWKMQARNKWMVDRCDTLVAVYDGSLTGGTAATVSYAKEIKREIIYVPTQRKFVTTRSDVQICGRCGKHEDVNGPELPINWEIIYGFAPSRDKILCRECDMRREDVINSRLKQEYEAAGSPHTRDIYDEKTEEEIESDYSEKKKSNTYVDIFVTSCVNEDGRDQDAVVAECSKCHHMNSSWGTGIKSINRCLVLMRNECPKGESNFYSDDSETCDMEPQDNEDCLEDLDEVGKPIAEVTGDEGKTG